MNNVSHQIVIVKPSKFSTVTYCTHSIKRCFPWLLSVDLKLKCSVVICEKLERSKSSVHTRLTDLLKNGKVF